MSILGTKKLNYKFLKSLKKYNIFTLGTIADINGFIKVDLYDKYPNCEALEDELSAYFDNELDLFKQEIIEQHIYNCKNCQAKLSEFKTFSTLIKLSQNTLNFPKFESIDFNILNECKQINSLLSAYLDEEVSIEIKLRVQKHLIFCKACQRDYYQLKELSNRLKSYFLMVPDYQFEQVKNNRKSIPPTN